MNCREVIERLLDYVESTAPREEFEHHLACCRSCRNYLDSYVKTIQLVLGAISE